MMSNLHNRTNEIIRFLSACENLKGIKFLSEMPNVAKPSPLRCITVSIGIDKLLTQPACIGEEKLQKSFISLGITVCAPYKFGSVACANAFANIAQALEANNDIFIEKAECSSASTSRSTDSIVLKGTISIQYLTLGDDENEQ